MRASTVKTLVTLLACWLLTACSQWHYDLGVPLADTPAPAQHTSLADALDLLGPPLRMSATDTGFVLAWEHWHIRENSVGFSLGALGADFMSADWGEMRIKGEFLLLTFDKDHLLTSATRSEWDNHGGGGKAIQPFFGFISVVDVDDLTEMMPQHRWGSALFQRLPGTLNANSNLDTGQSGLQQRGTPTAAGQQSLEMD
ncbi:MAG: hypothetical protein KDI33_03425 [Halioglobus sp.]|nr:hypothetical protein [Halioglobus sp.]